MSTMLEWAKYYRDKMGWSVIPLAKGQKIPPKGFSPIPYRQRYATDEELMEWFNNDSHNIGIVTGKLSNLLVIDLDKGKPEYDESKVMEFVSDSEETPTVSTPSGGQHLYYQYPTDADLSIGTAVLPAVDFRAEGGYVVAPPSCNGGATPYAWVLDTNTSIKYINNSFKKLLLNTNIYNSNNHANSSEPSASVTKRDNAVTSVTISLDRGSRDNSLFHIANTLIKGGMSEDNARYVMNILAQSCNPPFSESEAKTKIESALSRDLRKTMGVKDEVEQFVSVTDGDFSVTEVCQAVTSVTKYDRASIRKVIQRMKESGIIEKVGSRDGVYRRVDREYEVIDWMNAPTNPFKVKLPLGLDKMVNLYPGNIVVVAGASNAGKTGFLLNIVKENMYEYPIYYINSEMGETELKMRLSLFEDVPLTSWKFTPIVMKDGYINYVKDNRAIYIIDYMEISDNFYLVSGMLRQIHERLKDGICIVALQKKSGSDIGRGGEGTLEKPRLYVSLDKDEQSNIAKIVKAKSWVDPRDNPNGKTIRYKMAQGSYIKPISDWR